MCVCVSAYDYCLHFVGYRFVLQSRMYTSDTLVVLAATAAAVAFLDQWNCYFMSGDVCQAIRTEYEHSTVRQKAFPKIMTTIIKMEERKKKHRARAKHLLFDKHTQNMSYFVLSLK